MSDNIALLIEHVTFAWPWMFWLLPLPLLMLLLPPAPKRQQAALKLPNLVAATPWLAAADTQQRRGLPQLFALLAWCLLLLAAARPQWIGEPVELPASGRDLMLAVDISGSMEERDSEINGKSVSRLQAVQIVAGDFIRGRDGDRVGLLLFGERAYLQAPLSLDRETVAALLMDASVGLAGQRTAIGDAIGLSLKKLRDTDKNQQERVLVLLTDGASNAGALSVAKAVELAKTESLRIHTIAFGNEREVGFGFFKQKLAADVDERALQYVAEQTGGQYFRARDARDLAKIYGLIDELEPLERDVQVFRPVAALFWWPLAAALLLSLLGLLLQSLSSLLSSARMRRS